MAILIANKFRFLIAGILLALASPLMFGAPEEPIPPFGLIIDEAKPDPAAMRARIELITAGGLYPDREIYLVVSDATHPDNLNAIKDLPNIAKITRSAAKSREQMETSIKGDLTQDAYFMHATPKDE